MSNVILHADGCCLNNGMPFASGGYGIVVEQDNKVINEMFGKLRKGKQTNNRAELEAVYQALVYIAESQCKSFVIFSDSKTVVDGILGNARRTSNRDLWEEIETICGKIIDQNKVISIYHCDKNNLKESDSTYCFNVQADALAYQGANALIINRRQS